MQRLRSEIDRLQSAHDAAVNEARALKAQLDEQNLIIANSSPTTVVSNIRNIEFGLHAYVISLVIIYFVVVAC